jgi:hypothetical protein
LTGISIRSWLDRRQPVSRSILTAVGALVGVEPGRGIVAVRNSGAALEADFRLADCH